jgi:UDP-N-acetylmuramoyl-tripeptide--D-alanyl-D-alanine ligase
MKFDSVTNVRTFELIYKKDSLGLYKTSLLGEYVIGDILGCIQIAKHLNLSDTEIKIGIENIIPIPHRLQPIINSKKKIVIIDDSYNGNSTGVNEAIKVLNEYKSKRKIFVTPGIAETGDKNRTIHFEIGKKLSKVADLVVLINNSATPYIKEGLLYRDFSEKNILFFNSSLEAYEKINKILKPNDVILFQNDWPENYL